MKKALFLLLILFSFFFASQNVKVYALNTNDLYILSDVESTDTSDSSTTSETCPVFGDPTDKDDVAYYLQSAFDIMKFAGILLAIILTVVDLFKAMVAQDDAALKKVGPKAIKRVAYAIIIFFLPDIINMLFHLIGLYGTCSIS